MNTRGRTYRKRKKRKNSEFVSSNSDNLFTLTKWMGKRGFKPIKKLKPKIFKESGRGLMTEETINPGDIIVSIPENLLITPKTILDSYLSDILQRCCLKFTGHEILSVFLMCEYAKKQLSEWYPYICSLPKEYNIPVYFCHYILTRLPNPIRLLAQKQHETVRCSFQKLKPLFDELQTAYPAFKDILNFELYKWAWSSVNTRCIFMECIKDCSGAQCTFHLALAPFLDLLNHSNDVQIQASFNRKTNHYEIISHSKFKKYSQVYISYGCHDNQKLFLEYGFIIDNNYNDCVAFSLDDILLAYRLCNYSDKDLNPKLKFIKENCLLRNAVCTRDGISWNLSIIMKILISAYDIRLWNSFLHKASIHYLANSEYQKCKEKLINTKINEYKMNASHVICSKYYHDYLVSALCSNINTVLIKSLS